MEIWKDVPGWEGLYQVSDLGIIRSLDRAVPRGDGFMNLKGKITAQTLMLDGSGRLMVKLCRNNGSKPRYVHTLVALAFLGERPDKHEIHHIDENVRNNRLSNLEYIDYADHRRIHYSGERSARGKLKTDQVIEMRRLHKAGLHSVSELAGMFGIKSSSARKVVNRSSWKHVP